MKEVFVQPHTTRIAFALDEELNRRIGVAFSANGQNERIAAIVFALKELGSLTSTDKDGEEWLHSTIDEQLAACDVLRIELNEPKMTRSVDLSKRIMPALLEIWRGKPEREKAASDHANASQDHEFEVDPFVSQMARLIDREIIMKRPKFVILGFADRMARICGELQASGVATRAAIGSREDTRIIPIWTTCAEIDQRICGAKISDNERFAVPICTNEALLKRYQKVVARHLKRRLSALLEVQEAVFQLFNAGELRVVTVHPDGHYEWGGPDDRVKSDDL